MILLVAARGRGVRVSESSAGLRGRVPGAAAAGESLRLAEVTLAARVREAPVGPLTQPELVGPTLAEDGGEARAHRPQRHRGPRPRLSARPVQEGGPGLGGSLLATLLRRLGHRLLVGLAVRLARRLPALLARILLARSLPLDLPLREVAHPRVAGLVAGHLLRRSETCHVRARSAVGALTLGVKRAPGPRIPGAIRIKGLKRSRDPRRIGGPLEG
jgi:hypothetical protein